MPPIDKAVVADSANELEPWVQLLDSLSSGAENITLGLIAGGRSSNERRVLDRLARSGLTAVGGKGLLVRLNLNGQPVPAHQLRTARASEQQPAPCPSPLGKWKEVSVAMQIGATAPKALEQLPRWLAGWKKEYRRILLDLGPLDAPVCRAVGRFCDGCLLLLGPETCASPTWLRRNIDHLTQCRANLSGSIVITADELAVA